MPDRHDTPICRSKNPRVAHRLYSEHHPNGIYAFHIFIVDDSPPIFTIAAERDPPVLFAIITNPDLLLVILHIMSAFVLCSYAATGLTNESAMNAPVRLLGSIFSHRHTHVGISTSLWLCCF